MRITQKDIDNLNLATEDDRVTNGLIDFFFSSLLSSMMTLFSLCLTKNYIILCFIFLFFRIIYYIVLEYFFQRTLGKLDTGTMVIDVENKRVTLKQITIRNVLRLFTGVASLLGDDSKAIHDKVSNTYVIKSENLKEVKIGKYLILILSIIVMIRFIIRVFYHI